MPTAEDLPDTTDDLNQLLHPPYWFVHALPWPGGHIAEAAIAYAPITIPREGLSRDAQQILACADLTASRRRDRVIFVSDLTHLLAQGGASWNQLGIDWENGLQELADRGIPALYLTITEKAYAVICLPASQVLDTGAYVSRLGHDEGERSLVRRALAQQLENDWPSFAHLIVLQRFS